MKQEESSPPPGPLRSQVAPAPDDEEYAWSMELIPDHSRDYVTFKEEGEACKRFNESSHEFHKYGIEAVNSYDQLHHMCTVRQLVRGEDQNSKQRVDAILDKYDHRISQYEAMPHNPENDSKIYRMKKLVRRFNQFAARAFGTEKAINDAIVVWKTEENLYSAGGYKGLNIVNQFVKDESRTSITPRAFKLDQSVSSEIREHEYTHNHDGMQFQLKIAEIRQRQQNEVRTAMKAELLSMRDYFFNQIMSEFPQTVMDFLQSEFHKIQRIEEREQFQSDVDPEDLHFLIAQFMHSLYFEWSELSEQLNSLETFWPAECPLIPNPAPTQTANDLTVKIPSISRVKYTLNSWVKGENSRANLILPPLKAPRVSPLDLTKLPRDPAPNPPPNLAGSDTADMSLTNSNDSQEDSPAKLAAPAENEYGNDYVFQTWTQSQLESGCDELYIPKFLMNSPYRNNTRLENFNILVDELADYGKLDSFYDSGYCRTWKPKNLKDGENSVRNLFPRQQWKEWPAWKKFMSELTGWRAPGHPVQFDPLNLTQWEIHGDVRAQQFHQLLLHIHAFIITKDLKCSLKGINAKKCPHPTDGDGWSECTKEHFYSELERRFALMFYSGLAPFSFQTERIIEAMKLHEDHNKNERFVRVRKQNGEIELYSREYVKQQRTTFLSMQDRRPTDEESAVFAKFWNTRNIRFRQFWYIDKGLDAADPWLAARSDDDPEKQKSMKNRTYWKEFPLTENGKEILRTKETDFLFTNDGYPPHYKDARDLRRVVIPNVEIKQELPDRFDDWRRNRPEQERHIFQWRGTEDQGDSNSGDPRGIPRKDYIKPFKRDGTPNPNYIPLPKDSPLADMPSPREPRQFPAEVPYVQNPFETVPPKSESPQDPRAKAGPAAPIQTAAPAPAVAKAGPQPSPFAPKNIEELIDHCMANAIAIDQITIEDISEIEAMLEKLMEAHQSRFEEMMQNREFHVRRYELLIRVLKIPQTYQTGIIRNFIIQVAVERHLQTKFLGQTPGTETEAKVGPFGILQQVRNDFSDVYAGTPLLRTDPNNATILMPEFPESALEAELQNHFGISPALYEEAVHGHGDGVLRLHYAPPPIDSRPPKAPKEADEKEVEENQPRERSRSPRPDAEPYSPPVRNPQQLAKSFYADHAHMEGIEMDPRIVEASKTNHPMYIELLVKYYSDINEDIEFYNSDLAKFENDANPWKGAHKREKAQIQQDIRDLVTEREYVMSLIENYALIDMPNNPEFRDEVAHSPVYSADYDISKLRNLRNTAEWCLNDCVNDLLRLLNPQKIKDFTDPERIVHGAEVTKTRIKCLRAENELTELNRRIMEEHKKLIPPAAQQPQDPRELS